MGTTRMRMDLAYDGTDFLGWAVQPGQRTVQGEVEHWTTTVLRLDRPVGLVCAGRTDAGVHARAQVAHVDLPTGTDPATLLRRLRRVLPGDVAVLGLREAPPGFHARFSALWRRYVYRLVDGDRVGDPLQRGHVAEIRREIDVDRFNQAAATLLGLHDFAPFCRRRAGATTIRTLQDVEARRVCAGPLGSRVEVTVRADAFCHSMVRSLVGALTAVATGQRDPGWLAAVAASGRRHYQVQVMPARGLTLEEVRYPPDDELASRAEEARSVRGPVAVDDEDVEGEE
ncbi:tRNA pseudouridine(38-40) synthase TruA [Auraticoccus sp. F435]|uniref:tRNA pseudouridine synthase A n=1 Tax=Auraticoccus cholistanensis TaxID=2656650 RepID=A0A6A9UYI0_9ACTN|nr:tRNA pseudouridine(38-40) synthase TruA [Auraticoccus cholistanensis]MVA76902.1 tRNA pseudouridine(38-40) synthase TruA [Auraticoccus cholistanensis]